MWLNGFISVVISSLTVKTDKETLSTSGQMGLCSSAIKVICDFEDLWLSTVSFPCVMWTSNKSSCYATV